MSPGQVLLQEPHPLRGVHSGGSVRTVRGLGPSPFLPPAHVRRLALVRLQALVQERTQPRSCAADLKSECAGAGGPGRVLNCGRHLGTGRVARIGCERTCPLAGRPGFAAFYGGNLSPFASAWDLSPFTGVGGIVALYRRPALCWIAPAAFSSAFCLKRAFRLPWYPHGDRKCPLASFPRSCCPGQGPAGKSQALYLRLRQTHRGRLAIAVWSGLPTPERQYRYCRFRSQGSRCSAFFQNQSSVLAHSPIRCRRAGRRHLRRPNPSNRRRCRLHRRHCRRLRARRLRSFLRR